MAARCCCSATPSLELHQCAAGSLWIDQPARAFPGYSYAEISVADIADASWKKLMKAPSRRNYSMPCSSALKEEQGSFSKQARLYRFNAVIVTGILALQELFGHADLSENSNTRSNVTIADMPSRCLLACPNCGDSSLEVRGSERADRGGLPCVLSNHPHRFASTWIPSEQIVPGISCCMISQSAA